MYVMTSHGTLLCFDIRNERLLHLPMTDINDATRCVEIELPSDVSRTDFVAAVENRRGERAVAIPDGPLRGFNLEISSDWRSIAFIREGLYLAADPSSPEVENNSTVLEAWETFACVSRDELLDLIFVFGYDWVIKSTAKLVRPTEIGFESPFLLRFGDVAFDLRYNLPFMSAERDQDWNDAGGRPEDHIRLFSITLLTDGWRIDGARLFRPLIFYTAFKSPAVHGQVEVSIGSLIEFGRYAGHVHVITDRTKEAVLEALPGLPENALSVQRIDAEDFVGYVSAKYTILDWHDAYSYQPIFFMDADIVFDHDIEEMLLAVALSDRISAPIELGNLLESHPGVGSTLIQAAGHSPRYATGFNAGTIGVPNLRDHGNVLELIRRILVNRLDLFGRLNMIWVDQEIANYVSYRVANFDTHLLSRYTRIAIPDVEHDPRHRTGLVHFWPFGAPEDKLRGMITYLEILRRS